MKINHIIHACLITLTIYFFCPSIVYSDCGKFSSGDLLKTCQVGIKSAEEKLADLTPADAYNSGTCLGYLKGFIHMEMLYSATLAVKRKAHATEADLKKMALFCLPSRIENKEYAEIYINYMQKHPEEMDKNACSSVLNALSQAFPCK